MYKKILGYLYELISFETTHQTIKTVYFNDKLNK